MAWKYKKISSAVRELKCLEIKSWMFKEEIMEKKPLYRSLRASYSRDIFLPFCGVVSAPVVMMEIQRKEEMKCLTSERPPQNVILHVNNELKVIGDDGQAIEDLFEVLLLCSRSVPILYFDSFEIGEALVEFVEYHNLADAMLCTPYDKRHILAFVYEKVPLLRGMLDVRNVHVSERELPGIAVSNGASAVIVSAHLVDEKCINSLQKRFIHVVTTDDNGFGKTAVSGANGIITKELDEAYSFLSCFPEGAVFRKRNLYAHKGFQYDGKYSENTITAVVAAGEHHFDGAEIDVKLTRDDVPVVMHNVDTRGLFDCETLITEECDYEVLASLKRIGFPGESIDRLEDLMNAMKAYEDTPVLIELKPSKKYCNVEEMVRLVDPILRSPTSQQNCICIMGYQEPGFEYVHKRLPYLPLSYCEGVGSMPKPPENRDEAESWIYRIAKLTKGYAGGYNGEDVGMNRLLNEYAKFRMITMFPWSRSWTMEPSKWEENGPDNCRTYLAGYDAWTTDHGEKFLDFPIKITPIPLCDGDEKVTEMESPFEPKCYKYFRDGRKEESICEILVLSGEVWKNVDGTYKGKGKAKVMLELKIKTYFGETYSIYSEPIDMYFQ